MPTLLGSGPIPAYGADVALRPLARLFNVTPTVRAGYTLVHNFRAPPDQRLRHHFTAALEIQSQRLGREHIAVAEVLNDLGLIAQLEHRPMEAERWYSESLGIRSRLLGHDHPEIAGVLSNLGSVMLSQNRLDEAEEMHRRALAIRVEEYGPQHPTVATSHKNLGLVYLRRHEPEARFRPALAPADSRLQV